MRFTQLGVNSQAIMVSYTFSNDTNCWETPGLLCSCFYNVTLQLSASPTASGDTPQPTGGATSGAPNSVSAALGMTLAAGALAYLPVSLTAQARKGAAAAV